MIISASRRTDIPAFYSDWFINRIRQGFLLTRNPFNTKQIKQVSLSPSDVDVIVFWTRNPAKLMPYLDELDQRGFRCYFQFTITGYPKVLEKATLHPRKAIAVFKALSEKIDKDRVIWRYDPILITNLVSIEEHICLFSNIADELKNHTNQVIISFADIYPKVKKNLKHIEGLIYKDITQDPINLEQFSTQLLQIAQQNGLAISTCAESRDLAIANIPHGKCIDEQLIKDIFNIQLSDKKDNGQRKACGCIKSLDIGAYNTCLHGCSYCYATFQHDLATRNYKLHNPNSPFLLGEFDESLCELPLIDSKQKTLFQ